MSKSVYFIKWQLDNFFAFLDYVFWNNGEHSLFRG